MAELLYKNEVYAIIGAAMEVLQSTRTGFQRVDLSGGNGIRSGSSPVTQQPTAGDLHRIQRDKTKTILQARFYFLRQYHRGNQGP